MRLAKASIIFIILFTLEAIAWWAFPRDEYFAVPGEALPQDNAADPAFISFSPAPLGPVPLVEPLAFLFRDSEVVGFVARLERSGLLQNSARWAVDFGANDGSGPTEGFYDNGYAGLVVEGDSKWKNALNGRFPSPAVVKTIDFISSHSAMSLLRAAEVPMDVHFFKIDLDADDCATLYVLISKGFRPRVVQMEFTYDLPFPWAFAVLPLSSFSYEYHYGFQSCSLAFIVELLRRFGYKLVAVGGTKDAVFCHGSSMGQLQELDAAQVSYAFGHWAIKAYSPNPSNSRQFDLEGRSPASIRSSDLFSVDPAQVTVEVVAPILNLACSMRAALAAGTIHNVTSNGSSCLFSYVLSRDPSAAVDGFIRALGS